MRTFFIFDVESIGLHGEAFAVAGGIWQEDGTCVREWLHACPQWQAHGTPDDRQWVSTNVPKLESIWRSAFSVRTAFWKEWISSKDDFPEILMAVECGWPVEARFLAQCIDDDIDKRRWMGPYPMHEIATYMLAAGMDPMKTYDRLPGEMPAHNPVGDVRLSARLLVTAIQKLELDSLKLA